MTEITDTILVHAVDTTVVRSGRRSGLTELNVQILSDNVNIFLTQIEQILSKSPETLGAERTNKFNLKKFTVSAEISATGKLVIMGVGGEAAAKGALTFEFKRE